MSERVSLTIEDGIGKMLTQLAGSERKRGQWLSGMVRAMYEAEQQAQASDVEQLKFALSGVIGQQKQLEGRMLQMERQVAALMCQ